MITELRAMHWRRVVILTGRDDAYAVKAALGAGVRGFVVSPRIGSHPAPRNVIPMQRGRGAQRPTNCPPVRSRSCRQLPKAARTRESATNSVCLL